MKAKEYLLIGGDLFPTSNNIELFNNGLVDELFGEQIKKLFNEAKTSICNLEGVFADKALSQEKSGPIIRAQVESIKGIKELGVDFLSLANNHISDCNIEGFCETIEALNSASIGYFGAGLNVEDCCKYVTLELSGKKICVYGVAETMFNSFSSSGFAVNLYDEYSVCMEIASLKKEHDYVIVLYHGGAEYFQYPSPEVKKRFHRMADCGADAIIAQHTHCIGCEEYYNSSYLLYGQGNFLFSFRDNSFTREGLLLQFEISDSRLEISKHLLSISDGKVRLNDSPNWNSLNERSKKVLDDLFIEREFMDFAKGKLFLYIDAFRKNSLSTRLIRRIFPTYYKKRVLLSLSRRQVIKNIHTLRSEQNRELALYGLLKLLKNK